MIKDDVARRWALSAGLTAALIATWAANAAAGTLEVTMEGLRNDKGQIYVCLWAQGQADFPKCSNTAKTVARLSAPASKPVVIFENVPDGTFAVTAMHDETGTGNGEFNFLGLPKSGVGLSNQPSLGMTNRPSFDKGKFAVPATSKLAIKANYLF